MQSTPAPEWEGAADGPVYGLTSPGRTTSPRITVNRFGADYGDVVWQISADYRDDDLALVTVHTILRRKAMSEAGDRWVESGLREAKGLVAADLGASVRDVDIADRPWEATTLLLDGAEQPAEALTSTRGTGWVLELESVVLGLVGFDPAQDTLGRIDQAPTTFKADPQH